jgi:hypothetical protein
MVQKETVYRKKKIIKIRVGGISTFGIAEATTRHEEEGQLYTVEAAIRRR